MSDSSNNNEGGLVMPIGDLLIAGCAPTEMTEAILKQYQLGQQHFILEPGCGSGKLATNLAVTRGCHATLLDNDDGALRLATRIKCGLEGIRNMSIPVTIRKADIRKIPFMDDTFHLVLSEGVVEHFKPPITIMREMLRVSKDALVVMTPNGRNEKQVRIAKQQVEAYKDKPDFWASYEKPMGEEDLRAILEELQLKEIFVTLLWSDKEVAETKDDNRIIFGFGRKGRQP